MANEFKVKKGLIVVGSGSASPIVDVQGSQGQLFSITDSLSGSLFSANDISGIPVIEAFSDTTVKMGQYNAEAIILSGSEVRIGNRASNNHSLTGSLRVSGSTSIIGATNVTGSLLVSGSVTSTGTITAQTLVVQTVSSSIIYSSGSNTFGNSLANNQVLTGSVIVTGSLSVNGSNAVLVNQTSSFVQNSQTSSFATFTALNAYTSSINSYTSSLNARTSSFATTGSNTFNGNQVITGSLTVGSGSVGSGENTLIVGPAPNGGAGEGGQILLSAVGGTHTSASMLDNYQNRFRILRGTNASSDAEIASFNMHSGQLVFNRYTGSGAFSGTAAANLAVDSSGNVITIATGGGGGGTTDTGSLATTGSNLFRGDQRISGSLTVTSSIYQGAFASNETQLTGYGLVVQGAAAKLRVGPNYTTGGDRDYIDILADSTNAKITTNNENFSLENRESNGNISLVTSGSGNVNVTGSLRVTGSTSITGNTSIGTTSSTYKLQVQGDSNSGIFLKQGGQIGDSPSSTTFYNGITFENTSTTNAWSLGYSQGAKFSINYFDAGSTYNRYFTIDTSGNVGINKVNQNATFDVNGSSVFSGSLTVFTGSGVEFQVTNTGVKIGNVTSDTHTVTGSLIISGSTLSQNGSNVVLVNQTSSFTLNSQTSSFATFTALNAYTSSINSYTSSLNSATSSFVRNSQTSSFVLNSQTSSFATFTALNAYTSSINSYTSSLNSATSSFVRNSQTSSMSVSSATTAGTVTGTSGQLLTKDDRIIEPNSISAQYLQFGFTSWANSNSSPWADYLHLRSYSDASGGNDNLIMFRKDAIGMRIWQQSFGSATAYSSYVDVLHSGNYTSYTYTFDSLTSKSSGTGTYQTSGDFRAPIFYDSNNTGYYCDPNGTSLFVGLTVSNGRPIYLDGANGNIKIQGSSGGWATGYFFNGSSGTFRGGFGALGGTDALSYYFIGPEYNNYYAYVDSSQLSHVSSVRGPIFYDSDNTAFYINPAGGSNISSITVAATGAVCATFGGEVQIQNNASYGTTHFNYSAGGGNNYIRGVTYFDSGTVYYTNSNLQFNIGYDYNNTGYYIDPSSTSNINAINIAGNSNIFGGYGPGSGPGLGIENQTTFIRFAFWAMDFYDWNVGVCLTLDGGYAYNSTSMRSPIFYDQDNTGYYLNPNGTSNLLDVTTNSLGVGTAAPGTAGLIRATNDVVAYYSSDRRLKDNIKPIKNSLEKISKIGGYEFDWNDKQEVYEGHDIGVIAQEIEEILPEIVTTRDSGYKAVKYEKIVPLLIEGIKEQQQQINELKELVNKLINK